MSCEAGVTAKANSDYSKRTMATVEETRKRSTYVALTARKWPQKSKWLAEKRTVSDWAEVRAFDSDDLEQWFEQTPAIALRFADEIGIAGHGIEDVQRHWRSWAEQCEPIITPGAFVADRESARQDLLDALRLRLRSSNLDPVTIRADSAEEAAAFAVSALIGAPDLGSKSVVVTDVEGWRFVDQNEKLGIIVASRPELAKAPTRRQGTVVIVPYAAGDLEAGTGLKSARSGGEVIKVERADATEFAKALVTMGLEEGDAQRLSASTGRSWSVLRRRRATNPSIRQPPWLQSSQTPALTTLCLLGSWSGRNPIDRTIVAELADRAYDSVERDLRELARVDDAPVLQIGDVWRAKSPLELLDLYGGRLTQAEIDRFIGIAERVLTARDPQLDLPNAERYAAQIHGKNRPESGILIQSICDALIKLAVRGPTEPVDLTSRISTLVRHLLHNADSDRWLSLSRVLPDLAEAAPNIFLEAVEASLAKPDMPVARLLTETGRSGLTSRCWHSGLLWALERLAWSPQKLTRVALLLARLSNIPITGNWGNTPARSLFSLFRSWLPQTAANLEQRIATIDTLIAKEPDAAFEVLDRLVYVGSDTALPSARPEWRDDDAAAGRSVPFSEQQGMLIAAADRLLDAAKNSAEILSKLVEKLAIFDEDRQAKVLSLAETYCAANISDEEKDIVRKAFRNRLYRALNFDEADATLSFLEDIYERLAPSDLIVRHRWLFQEGWPRPPWRTRDENYRVEADLLQSVRLEALKAIYAESSFNGIERMASVSPNQHIVGATLDKLSLSVSELGDWIILRGEDFKTGSPYLLTISALLRAREAKPSRELLETVLAKQSASEWLPEQKANFLQLARVDRETWETVASHGQAVEDAYWAHCKPEHFLRDDQQDFEFAIARLMSAGRARTALQVCQFDFAKIDADLLAEMIERLLAGEELDGPLMDSYHLGEAVDALEKSNVIDRNRLVRLEFGVCRLLGYGGEHHAAALYEELASDPKLFAELVCLAYRRADGKEDSPSEAQRVAAEIAWHVLHACRRQPGTGPSGAIVADAFTSFVDAARTLCGEQSLLSVCDSLLGAIFAHAPVDEAGVWPCAPVRDLLDRAELVDMRASFQIGAMNKRGVTSRAAYEGGNQERELAAKYRGYGAKLENTHVHLAAAMEQLADRYEDDARREDSGAQLRREGR